MMKTVTIRFQGDQEMIDNLVTAWLEDEGVTLRAGSKSYSVELTYVKESR